MREGKNLLDRKIIFSYFQARTGPRKAKVTKRQERRRKNQDQQKVQRQRQHDQSRKDQQPGSSSQERPQTEIVDTK